MKPLTTGGSWEDPWRPSQTKRRVRRQRFKRARREAQPLAEYRGNSAEVTEDGDLWVDHQLPLDY